jgi:alpha-L-fucosidase
MDCVRTLLQVSGVGARGTWWAVVAVVGGLWLGGGSAATAAERPGDRAATESVPTAAPEDMQWWREARFGMFIHWGPVSLKGTEIGWSRGGERRGRGGTGTIPVEEYDNLYKRFNPTKFDARQWVAIAKSAGMKYLVFTTKHHDGFCMFDNKLTDYTIMHSPFGRDIVAELAAACHGGGLRLGFYYSPPDWHHPDYRTENHAKYIQYLHGQIRELCTNYGRVDILWFDGLGGTAEDWDAAALHRMIRTLQPHALINNRAGLPGDFDTPEQRVGAFQPDRAWESCITIANQWAYKPNDPVKSLKRCIQTLVRCAGGDGNLLLNVGPMPTGEIEPTQVARLREIGQWLKRNGASIYATRGGPFMPGGWGASTHRGTTVYVHVLNWPRGDDAEPLVLPGIDRRIVSASLLGGGAVKCAASEGGIALAVPAAARDPIDTIIVLKLHGPAEDVKPVAVPSLSLAAGKKATASNVFRKNARFAAGMAVDDNEATRWATDAGTHEGWLEVDLGKPATFDTAVIKEAYHRVRRFELQCKRGDAWETIRAGRSIGEERVLEFPPVTAQHVRLAILEATKGPTIWEFQLYGSKD